MTEKIKFIDIKEFREFGYLQEVNRRFFHPLGLALEVQIDEQGNEKLGRIWDYRNDPEGLRFEPAPSFKKYKNVTETEEQRKPRRISALGYWIQPTEGRELNAASTDAKVNS